MLSTTGFCEPTHIVVRRRMKRARVSLTFIALSLFSFSPLYSLEETIFLRDFAITVPMEYGRGDEAWARYMLSKSADHLAAAEAYLDTSFSFPDGFTIKACDGCGSMNASEVYIDYSANPALLFHELAHFWYGYSPGDVQERWLVEGINSFLPIAMHRAGVLKLSMDEYLGIWDAWLFHRVTDHQNDLYLSHERAFSKDEVERYDDRYFKSFKVQYLLYMELGAAGYQRFLRSLLAEKPQSNDDILNLLYSIRRKDWQAFLAGWVFEGNYSRVELDSFGDSDADRLLDIEEEYLGTSPHDPDSDDDGYSDYWEYIHNYDPAEYIDNGLPPSPAIDGVAERMYVDPDYMFYDKRSDNKGSADVDYIEIYRLPNGSKRIYLRAFFVSKELRDSFHTLHIRRPDGHNYWIQTNHPVRSIWASEYADGERFENWRKITQGVPGVRMQFCDVFEAILDLDELHIDDDFQLAYIAGGYSGGEHIWDSDRTNLMPIPKMRDTVRFDGKIGDLIEAIDPSVTADPFGDAEGDDDLFDLKSVYAGIREAFLYVGADFHRSIDRNDDKTVVVHIHVPATEDNYWIGFVGQRLDRVRTFENGTPVAEWEQLVLSNEEISRFRFARTEDVEIRIPISLLERSGNVTSFRFSVIFGSTELGLLLWDSDRSDFITVAIEN